LVVKMNRIMETKEEFKSTCSLDLFEYINWKNDYPKEAEKALSELSHGLNEM